MSLLLLKNLYQSLHTQIKETKNSLRYQAFGMFLTSVLRNRVSTVL